MQPSTPTLFMVLLAVAFTFLPARADESDGTTPLMSAAARGELEKMGALLDGGAAVDSADARGHTTIWHAVNGRQPAALALLLARADRQRCPLGRDALRRALEIRDWALIQPLLDAGRANLVWTLPARRALAAAINARDAAKVKALIAHHRRDPVMEGSRHPLLAYAITASDAALTRFLLECGCDPDTRVGDMPEPDFIRRVSQKFTAHYLKYDRGMTVLMLAAGMDRAECARLLVARGANRGVLTRPNKMPALTFAAKAGSIEIMRTLIADCPPREKLRIEISVGDQMATLYRNDRAVESTEISTGVPGFETPTGRYLITDKQRHHVSNVYKGAKMPFFMRLNCEAFSLHQGYVTGGPASHGCIRLPGEYAAKWFRTAPIGTEVEIY